MQLPRVRKLPSNVVKGRVEKANQEQRAKLARKTSGARVTWSVSSELQLWNCYPKRFLADSIGSQAVEALSASERGYDAAKKVVCRKWHNTVNTAERLLMANTAQTDIAGSTGTQAVMGMVARPDLMIEV